MRASERERAKELDRQSEGKLRELKFAAFEYHKMHTYTYVCKYACMCVYVLYICASSIYMYFCCDAKHIRKLQFAFVY